MSNWLPDSPFWDPRLHETLLQEALLPEGIREHFKPGITRVQAKSTSWLLAAHQSQTTLMCLHLLHSKKELLYLHDHDNSLSLQLACIEDSLSFGSSQLNQVQLGTTRRSDTELSFWQARHASCAALCSYGRMS